MTYGWAGYAGATLGSWAAFFIVSALFCFVVNRYIRRKFPFLPSTPVTRECDPLRPLQGPVSGRKETASLCPAGASCF
jgi:hypothetical protein